MAEGVESTFKIYEKEYQGGQYEVIAQNVNAFNAASQGSITLATLATIGDYEKEAFIRDISSTIITRRDLTSTSTASGIDLTEEEYIRVKVSRKIGPIEKTLSSWKKIGMTPQVMSFIIGGMVAKAKLADYLNSGLAAVANAIENVGNTVNYNMTALTDKSLSITGLVNGLKLFGDRAGDIVCWVMHSKPYFDLMIEQTGVAVSNQLGLTIAEGSVKSLGRPIIFSDSAALTDANGSLTDSYNVLGLTKGALTIVESEVEQIIEQDITGHEQLFKRIQGEHSFTVGVRGYQWDTSNGGKNPTIATLGTGTNWDKIAASIKDTAGIVIKCQ